jgi:hypothetical protein
MSSIVLNTTVEQDIRVTVFTALMDLQDAQGVIKDKDLQIKTLENYLDSNASQLAEILSINSFLTPRGVIGATNVSSSLALFKT